MIKIKEPRIPKQIPFLSLPDEPMATTSQNFIPIADIVNNIVIFKDGGAALILESTSLNFGLLSEREQEAVVVAYAALINSLSFALQIVVRTQKKDISNYLKYLYAEAPKIVNPKLQVLMDGYIEFISETIKKKNVLEKRFYLVVPFSPYELGVVKSVRGIATAAGPLPFSKEYVMKKAVISMYPKRDHLMRQAARLGLKLRQLENAELVKLFYDVYNPNTQILKAAEEAETGGNL